MLVVGLLFLAWASAPADADELVEAEAESPGGAPGDDGDDAVGSRAPGGSSASTAPPKPPPIIRAPAAPACLSLSTVASTSGTETS